MLNAPIPNRHVSPRSEYATDGNESVDMYHHVSQEVSLPVFRDIVNNDSI